MHRNGCVMIRLFRVHFTFFVQWGYAVISARFGSWRCGCWGSHMCRCSCITMISVVFLNFHGWHGMLASKIPFNSVTKCRNVYFKWRLFPCLGWNLETAFIFQCLRYICSTERLGFLFLSKWKLLLHIEGCWIINFVWQHCGLLLLYYARYDHSANPLGWWKWWDVHVM